MAKRCTRAVAATMLWAASLAQAQTGGLSVAPVRLHFGERDRAVALRLSNAAAEALTLHADIQAWSQDAEGRDRLEPSEDLVVSPPVLHVAPGGEQVVRIVLAVPRNPTRQMTYRLFLREQLRGGPAQAPGAQRPSRASLPIALALSLPVFITPAHARHGLRCELAEPAHGRVIAQCENTGLAHALLGELELSDGVRPLARHEGGVYLLAGTRRTIALTAATALSEPLAPSAQPATGRAEPPDRPGPGPGPGPAHAAPGPARTAPEPPPPGPAGWTLRARLDRNETMQWLLPASRQASR